MKLCLRPLQSERLRKIPPLHPLHRWIRWIPRSFSSLKLSYLAPVSREPSVFSGLCADQFRATGPCTCLIQIMFVNHYLPTYLPTYLLTYLLTYLMRCCERIRRRWIDMNSTWLQYDFMDLEGKSSKILLASAWGHLNLPCTRRPRPSFQVDGRVAALLLVSKCYSRVQYAVGNAVSRLAAHSRSQKTSV